MNEIDQKVEEFTARISKQKELVETTEKLVKGRWMSNCYYAIENKPINIQTASKDTVIHFVSYLLQQKESLDKAQALLNTKLDNVLFNGSSFEDWLFDCNKRLAILSLQEKKEKLSILEKKVEKVLSPEQKRLLNLQQLEKLMEEFDE